MSNDSFAPGSLLAQVRPAGTAAVTLLAARAIRTEVTLILAASSTDSTLIELFHDDDGTTFDATTLIMNRAPLINDSDVLFQAQGPGTGIMINENGALGAQIGVAGDVIFSVYGVTQTLADRVRGI